MSAGLHHASRCLVLPEGLEPSPTRLSTVRVCQLRHDIMIWYRRRDSNPHCLVPKTSASSRLGYAGMKDFGFRISKFESSLLQRSPTKSAIRISKSAILWWTWHDLNVRPRPSHGRALIPLSYKSGISGGERAALTATSAVTRLTTETLAEAAGLEPAHALRGDLANRCHTIRRRLQENLPTRYRRWF